MIDWYRAVLLAALVVAVCCVDSGERDCGPAPQPPADFTFTIADGIVSQPEAQWRAHLQWDGAIMAWAACKERP